jgi:hypothetical protein
MVKAVNVAPNLVTLYSKGTLPRLPIGSALSVPKGPALNSFSLNEIYVS